MEYNVTYTYGADGPDRGRLVRIEDGTGVRELSYDALGNVRGEIRTVALPGTAEVYTFATRYRHDSWGRMVSMTYFKFGAHEKAIIREGHSFHNPHPGVSINNSISEIHVPHIHIKEIEYGKENVYIGFVDCLFN